MKKYLSFGLSMFTLSLLLGGVSAVFADNIVGSSKVFAADLVGGERVFKDNAVSDPIVSVGSTQSEIVSVCPTMADSVITHTLTYTAGANGTIQGTAIQSVNDGCNGTAVIAAPDTNSYQVDGNWFPGATYHFVNWSDGRTDDPRTDLAVTGDVNVTANFAPDLITITATAGAGGSISPSGAVEVETNSTPAFTITPNSGYRTLSVMVDDVFDVTGGAYTFPSNRTHHNHYITATFEASSRGGSSGGGRITPPVTEPAPEGEVLGAETFQFTRTLRFGMKGNDVLELHNKLTELGYYKGPIDNKFQSLLRTAVRNFQSANSPLLVDGIVGPHTQAVLNILE